MAWDANWRERVAWSKRSPEFGELTVRDGRPVMKYLAPLDERTWDYWLRLAHPSVLSARAPRLLDYAAIDWDARPASRALAGIELARVYEWLVSTLGEEPVAEFAAPRVFYDLGGEVRIAFVTPTQMLKPKRKLFRRRPPRFDERALVRVIGECLRAMETSSMESADVARLVERAAKRGFRSLAAMRAAFEAADSPTDPANDVGTWTKIEEGIGFLEVDHAGSAAICFTNVLVHSPTCRAALDGRAVAELRVKELAELPSLNVIVDPNHPVMLGVRPRARRYVGREKLAELSPKLDEADPEWLGRAAWDKRSPEFGELSCDLSKVTMSFGSSALVPAALWTIWAALPRHPNILEAVGPGGLRYAALDWIRGPVAIDSDPTAPASLAGWGATLTRIYEFLFRRVPSVQLGWLTCPFVRFDLEGELRIAFVMGAAQATALPPEVIQHWPSCDERSLVFTVGKAINALGADMVLGSALPIGDVVRRCVETDPARRFENLDVLRRALVAVGGTRKHAIGLRKPRREFDELERALGWRLIDDKVQGAKQGGGHRFRAYTVPAVRSPIHQGLQTPIAQHPPVPSLPARYLGSYTPAPVSTELTPARAAYLEGKAALVRGKLADARDAFDRALALQPQMLEAMLLRGEVERMTNRLRREVGTGEAKALPSHLAAIEPLLLGDRFEDGIAQLRAFEDAASQQLLADVLVQHGRAEEALAIYDRLTSSEALAGRAAALQQLGRSGEAEAALDHYVALAVTRSELRTRGAQR